MTDSLTRMPSGSLDDDAGNIPLNPSDPAVLYALTPKDTGTASKKEENSILEKLPFLCKKKKS